MKVKVKLFLNKEERKMYKTLIVALIALLTVGCNIVEGWKVERANAFCADKGGIHHIFAGAENLVTCNNGERENIDG